MANIDNINSVQNDEKQIGKKNVMKVLIITSGDDNNDDDYHEKNIISCLTPSNTETIVVNLNNKRSLLELENGILNHNSKNGINKRRKPDLTCVICGGRAFGYNFEQISCESCKAFFRRNALHPIEKTKCLGINKSFNTVRCNIQYDVKHKCQRCRLLKCLESGMRKDYVLTTEEKQLKQKRLEENRQIRLTQTDINNKDIKSETNEQSPGIYTEYKPINNIPLFVSHILGENDWSCLHYIENAYSFSLQSAPSASSVLSLELAPDRMSAYMNTLDIQNYAAVKLINFVRQIPDFEQLYESDRLMLVKYNLTLLFVIRGALNFDATRELMYDDPITNSVSPSEEAFALHCKSLFILCYGYEFNRLFMSILHSVTNLVDKDSKIAQLLMLNMIFLKGLSVNDDQEPLLNDNLQVFNAHSKYTDLLFRYLIQRYSFNVAVIKMIRITEVFIRSQRIMRDFHQYIKSRIDINYINPLMKSLLQLT